MNKWIKKKFCLARCGSSTETVEIDYETIPSFAQVWIIYGDGALGFSIAEIDSMVRQGVRVVALVGNDAAWTQIAREQEPILGSRVACDLRVST